MKLVIVESPTKCKTIKKYLGEDYQVLASCGHIRDLSTKGKGGLGVDIDNDFKPTYENAKDKAKIISDLKSALFYAKYGADACSIVLFVSFSFKKHFQSIIDTLNIILAFLFQLI